MQRIAIYGKKVMEFAAVLPAARNAAKHGKSYPSSVIVFDENDNQGVRYDIARSEKLIYLHKRGAVVVASDWFEQHKTSFAELVAKATAKQQK